MRVGPALTDRYRVYALDMRGHGDSIKPSAGAYSLRQTADDAVAFIGQMGFEKPLLIGHSWGGAVSLALAVGKPAPALSKLILEDPASNFGQGEAEKRAAFYTKDIGRSAAELRPEIIATSPGWTEVDIEGKVDAMGKVSREAVISVFHQGSTTGNMLPLLAQLTMPTLLMRADPANGSIIPDPLWDEARHMLPSHSSAVQIDGSTHNIHRGSFEAFMQAVNDFLSK